MTVAAVLAASAALTSGLHGLVTRGPVTPVCRAGTRCSAPASHVSLVFSRHGLVERTTTDARGRYRITLRPGLWKVRAPHAGFAVTPTFVVVRAGVSRLTNLSIDTGIR